MFTCNVRRITLFLWLRGKKGELRAVGKAGKPLHGLATGGSFPLPSRWGPTPTPIFAKSADPDYSNTEDPAGSRAQAAAHMAYHVGHTCVTRIVPGLHGPSWHPPQWDSPPQGPLQNSSFFGSTKRQNFLLNDLDYLKMTIWAVGMMVGAQD